MKKFLVVVVVLAITCFSVVAFAGEVSLGGSYAIRSRDFTGLKMTKETSAADSGTQRDTQTQIRIDVNAKAGDNLKGKLQLEHDFGTGFSDWGAFENYSVSSRTTSSTDQREGMGFREAWVMFQLPGIPVTIKGGHQLLQLGNGWFFRSQHYGSDAWVVFNDTGNNHLGFVNVKISEGAPPAGQGTSAANIASADDADAYVIVDTYKINDNNKVGIDITYLNDRRNALGFGSAGATTNMTNIGLNYNGKVGPLALKAQIDINGGDIDNVTGSDPKFKGNQIVIEGSMPMDKLELKFWLARGSGKEATDTSPDRKDFVNFLDIDPHYAFLYEYKVITAAGRTNTGFSNTTALGLGAMFAASKSVSVGGNLWYLQATEKTNVAARLNATGSTNFVAGTPDDAVGYEVDLMLNWKLYDNLAWNWVAGYFAPGDVYKGRYTPSGKDAGTEATTGIQGILRYTF